MLRFYGLLRTASIAVVATVLLASIVLYALASRSLPNYSGDRAAAGVAAPVEIVRDQRAVPHIFAQSRRDAFFALGYAHAQDRLWQMELRRRLAQGRLTELAGFWGEASGRRDELLRLDLTARALDLEGRAAAALEGFRPETRDLLAGYAEGVNAWLATVDDGSLGRGAPELLFLGASVAPWRPVDSVAAFKLLAALRSVHVFAELDRARFLTVLGPEKTFDLFPADRGPAMLAPPAFGDTPAAVEGTGPTPRFGAVDPGAGGGSNIWAAAASRSAARAPLMASDPHLPLTAPGLWYAARMTVFEPTSAEGGDLLQAPDFSAVGVGVPGVPALLYGRNASLAWGAAGLAADVGDIFLEAVDPADTSRYRTPEGWAEFETKEVQIPLGDGTAAQATLRWTRHGPVLPMSWPQVAAATPVGHVAALSWTALDEDDTSLEAAIRMMSAGTVDEGLDVAADHVAPPQTLVLADQTSIAMTAVGRIPVRDVRSLSRGATPGLGWRRENAWRGRVGPAAMPRAVDPPSGLVANANNRVVDRRFPHHLGQDWAADYRFERLAKLLNSRQFHTLNGFQSIQTDTVSEMARAVLPLIGADLWTERGRERGLRREALDRLADWSGDMDAFLAEPLIFATWIRRLTRRLTEDDLAGMRLPGGGARPQFLERVYRDPDGVGRRWCDDLRTPNAESCAAQASAALDDALAELSARYGGVIGAWRWGRAHEAVHRHQPFGAAPFIGAFLNIRQETGGGEHTLFRGRFGGEEEAPFRNVSAGGYRAIYDFADLDRSVFAVATGQSGHFLSRHYDDFAELWRAGEYVGLSLARADSEAGSVGVTRLRPVAPAAAISARGQEGGQDGG